MGCLLPYRTVDEAIKNLKWPKEKRINKSFLLLLKPTHAMCICDAHEFDDKSHLGLAHVTKYCGANFPREPQI